ncbi:RNA helicase aquarius [Discoglossus pictus]
METRTQAPARKAITPTVTQINAERVTQLASTYWAPHSKKKLPFDYNVIEDIYVKEIAKSRFAIRKIMLLEFSQYLENYLWLNYSPKVSSKAYLMSICCMVNEKFRENVPAWETFKKSPQHFPFFFKSIMEASVAPDADSDLTLHERTVLLLFLDHCFNSLEVDLIRGQIQQLISLPMWSCLQPTRLEKELKKTPKLKKFWNLIKKTDEKMEVKMLEQAKQERTFLWQLIQKFLSVLISIETSGLISMDRVHYCERFIELMIDLEALLPTRRWFNTVLDDCHLVVHCYLSNLNKREQEGHLFSQLLDMLKFYSGFEINDQTGNALTENEMTTIHYDRITSLQRAAFAHFPELYNFALSNVAAVDTRESLVKNFGSLRSTGLIVKYQTEQIRSAKTSAKLGPMCGLRKHDVCFLITLRPTLPYGTKIDRRQPIAEQTGLVYVRGCEIQGMLDEKGRVIEEGPEPKPKLKGDQRTIRVFLDPNQYQQDMTNTIQTGAEDVYDTFNLIMRRKPKENNFKAVLETIRKLMNTDCVVPDWLHDIILGYGDPGSAHYSKMPNQIPTLDFNDTFLSLDHLKSSFPGYQVKVTVEDPALHKAPFRITFPVYGGKGKKRKEGSEEEAENPSTLIVEPHVILNRGPYPYNQPKRNTIQFTSTQTEAIRAGMQPGLTMVVGPPGTGKTDVAVQIISNLYHNFPEQRTLIVTHSNQALNQLFEKIMALDIDERHLLRLGHGEEELETEKDFSRYGRVNYVLARRLELLKEVGRLQESLGVPGDVSYTCETAGHFFLYQIMSRWEAYLSKVKAKSSKAPDVEEIAKAFPFHQYFSNAPQPIFKGRSYQEDMELSEGCFRHIKKIFTQLEEFRAFELLRSGLDRSKYLLVKEAKIIAMTCTHAALKRHDLVELGFKYDNVLMEEAAQILEIETFIPLLLQNPQDGFSRLKRWIMIGDHHQLPPVIKNMAFQKYSNMEQSLFTRFVRLGVPTVDLDAQGRARASLCNLYNWRYKCLGNLPHVQLLPEFRCANAGFLYDFQLINVEDFNGVGESEPNPYFYQNLAEAEYAVALFMYMRLLGYPANRISILTTYNGQKHLIRDIVNQRCGNNPLIGQPSKVTTVDRFQGQQNDYIILSLVRTKAVGHLRDVRRLVVAMSRARLGLYIFARVSLFQNCFELTPAFSQLTSRPLRLHILPGETFPAQRKNGEMPPFPAQVIKNMPEMANYVYNMYMHMMQSSQQYRYSQGLRPPPALTREKDPSLAQEEEMEVDPEKLTHEPEPHQSLGQIVPETPAAETELDHSLTKQKEHENGEVMDTKQKEIEKSLGVEGESVKMCVEASEHGDQQIKPEASEVQGPGASEGQAQGPGASEGQAQGPGASEGQAQGPGASEGQPQGPGASEGQAQGPGASEGQAQGPGASEGQAQGPGASEGQAQGPGASEGQAQGPGASEGQAQGPGASEGQAQGPGASEGQAQGPGASEGQAQGPGASEGQAQGPGASEGQAQGPSAIEVQQTSVEPILLQESAICPTEGHKMNSADSDPNKPLAQSEVCETEAGNSEELQGAVDTMEVEEAGASTEVVEFSSSRPEGEDTEHRKMPEHPGRDSDSEYSEDEGTDV